MTASTVSTPSNIYISQKIDVDKNRAAVRGERSIKQATVKYLPPIPSMCTTTTISDGIQQISVGTGISIEGQSAYNKYLSLSQFYGATGRTVDGLVGLIFSKPAILELPSNIEYMEKNIDSKGTTVRDFSKKICTEAFISPMSGILVARPSTPEGSSKAVVESMNIRPKLLHYNFDSIINFDYDTVNNENKLSFVVLVEEVSKRTGFTVDTEKQYRVLELVDGVYHQSLYDEKEDVIEPPAPVIINGKTSNEIPFYFINTGSEGKSIINDLVDVNLHHYKLSADYNSKLYFSSFTIYYETNVQNGVSNNMVIGNGVKWNGGVDAEFGILQPDGTADSHRLAMEDDEKRMAALGAEQLQPRGSMAESAEAKTLDQVAQNSTTANVAITVSEVLTKAFIFAAKWQGSEEDVTYQLNTDYNPTGMDAQSLTARWSVYMGGGMTFAEFHEGMQKGEVISTSQTAEEAKSIIDAEQSGMNNIE